MRTIDAIVIHCSATPEGKEYTLEDIDLMHRQRGYVMVGYNYVIELDGTIRTGRPLTMEGAHCRDAGLSGSSYNKHSIGICYIGGVESKRNAYGKLVARKDANGNPIAKDTRTDVQKRSLVNLVYKLLAQYPDIKEIIGHRDASPDKNQDGKITRDEWLKACPCFEVRSEFPVSMITARR